MARNPASLTAPSHPVAPAGEPIATPTIAEIYLRQGLSERALQVYRDLLLADPGSDEVRRKLEALEEKIRAEEQAARVEEAVAPEGGSEQPLLGAAAGFSRERQVEALERWMESARRRRRNVQ